MLSGDREDNDAIGAITQACISPDGYVPPDIVRLLALHSSLSDKTALMSTSHASRAAMLDAPESTAIWREALALHFPHADTYGAKTAVQFHGLFGQKYQRQLPKEIKQDHPRIKQIFQSAKEGDIEALKRAMPKDENGNDNLDDLLVIFKMKDIHGHTPLFYARKYQRQAWLDHCYQYVLLKSNGYLDEFGIICPVKRFSREGIWTLVRLSDSLAFGQSMTIDKIAGHHRELGSLNASQIVYVRDLYYMLVSYGHLNFIKWLATSFIHHYRSCLEEIFQSQNLNCIAYLLDQTTDSGFYLLNKLFMAIKTNDLNIVKLVLDKRPQLLATRGCENDFLKEALQCIAERKYIYDSSVIDFFLTMDKSVTAQCVDSITAGMNFTLIMKCMRLFPERFNDGLKRNLLLKYLRDHVNCIGLDPLEVFKCFESAITGKGEILILAVDYTLPYEVIEWLIVSKNENVAFSTHYAGNLLHILARANGDNYYDGQPKILKLILERNRDLLEEEYADSLCKPLDLAFRERRVDMQKALIDEGAKLGRLDSLFFGYHQSKQSADLYLKKNIEDKRKRQVLLRIMDYHTDRASCKDEYITTFLGINCGRSRSEKLGAAWRLFNVIAGDADMTVLAPYSKALNQGRLGKLYHSPEVQHYLANRAIESDFELSSLKL